MAQYISIDDLLSVIENLKKEEYYDIHDEYDGFVRNAFDKLFSSVNSMATKEVNLDAEIDKELETRWKGEYLYTTKFRESAKHFFELGMKMVQLWQK